MSCSGMRLGEADSHVAVQVGESWVSMWVARWDKVGGHVMGKVRAKTVG